MLSAAKHLSADRDRPFAEFTLSETNVLRVTLCDCSNGQGLFFKIEPCLNNIRSKEIWGTAGLDRVSILCGEIGLKLLDKSHSIVYLHS